MVDLVGKARQSLRLAAMAMLVAAMTGAAPGCAEQVTVRDEPKPQLELERLRQGTVDKIDLLLVIDNSRFMGDKQEVLKQAVPDLLLQLVNPLCICDAEIGRAHV